MSVLSDKWIKKMAKEHGMIKPFEEEQIRGNKISFGTSSVDEGFKCGTNILDIFLWNFFMFSSIFIGRQREPKNSLYRNIILSKASRLTLDRLRFYLLPVKNGDGYKQFAWLFHVFYQYLSH